MSNITINTDCLETIIEMINRCAADLDSEVSMLIDTSFASLVSAGLCVNIAGTLKSQCQTLDRRLGGCSIRLANFLSDYSEEEKGLEAYCKSLPQESLSVESLLNTDSFGFSSTPDATLIDFVNKGESISKNDNTNSQNIYFNTAKISEENLVNVNNENQLNEQQLKDNYQIEGEQLKNINNMKETIQHSAKVFEENTISQQNLYSIGNNNQLTIKEFAKYLKTQELVSKTPNSNIDRRV